MIIETSLYSQTTGNSAFSTFYLPTGKLLSVNPVIARKVADLFNLNERAVYLGRWQHGMLSMTAVGATNVGSIKVYADQVILYFDCNFIVRYTGCLSKYSHLS